MKQKILLFVGIVIMGAMAFSLIPEPVMAANSSGDCKQGGFLGFRAWYDGLPCEDGAIKAPKGDTSGASIAGFVWTIVANVLVDLFMVVGFLAVGFLMYGGYLYIMSNGDPGKVASGMKTIKAAIIGLIIAILANVIIRTILTILGL